MTYKILNSLIAPRDSTYLLARLKYFTQQTYPCVISETLQSIFLIVIVAGGIARGRVRTTAATTVESRKMAAILQIIG